MATTVLVLSGILPVAAPTQSLVKDINPGAANSAPGSLVAMGNTLFFRATDAVSGSELWRSDGTAAGTTLVTDINLGSASSTPNNLLVFLGVLYFTATDGTNGTELWRSDGTAAGTRMVADINPGTASSSPASLVTFGPFLFFAADDGSNGRELWRSDGTPGGTTMVADINPGAAGSNPTGLVFRVTTLFFTANDGASGIELWRSLPPWNQGSTSLVADINPGAASSSPGELVADNSAATSFPLVFRANNGTNGIELWRSDGTVAGTTMVADLNPGSGSSSPTNFTSLGPILFFAANDGTNGIEPWRTDGTVPGTVMIADVNAGSATSGAGSLVLDGATLFFTANDGVHGQEVWRSLPPWSSASTMLVRDINPGTASGIPPSVSAVATKLLNPAAHNVRILLAALDGINGSEPWVTDGVSSGTRMVADVNPGAGSSNPANFLRIGGSVYFTANDGAQGIELWTMPLGAFLGALAEPFGSGCPGTGGLVPRSNGLLGGAPVLGNAAFVIGVLGARAQTAAVLVLDVPRSPLPLPGGCTLFVPGLLLTFLTSTDGLGEASMPLPIPNDVSLVGGMLFSQWAVVDPSGPFLGLSFSDALRVVIGT